MRIGRILPLLFLVYACVEPLEVNFEQSENFLVVDGMITNEPGPYTVKLFYSIGLDSTLKRPKYETGASVWIVDDMNNSELLEEISPGSYQTRINGLKGEFGRSYYVRIVTQPGKVYETKPQRLVSPGSINSLYFEFEEDGASNYNYPSLDIFNIYADAKGIEGESNLLRWRWTGVFKGKTYPERKTKFIGLAEVPDPEPCSGYVYQGGELVKIDECTCCICWSFNYSNVSLVSDNVYVGALDFNRVEIGKVPITAMNFLDRYFVEVEQLSVSEEVYNFWRLLEIQQSGGVNIFQPNTVEIKGNVKCTSNPNEKVLGIFAVSGITRKSIFITPEQIPKQLPPIDTIGYDCQKIFKNATTQKPFFW